MNILCLPFTSQEGGVRENVAGALAVIRRELHREKADLVVLPELFTCAYAKPPLAPHAESADGPSVRQFQACARELDVHIGFGFAESSGGERVYNSWALVEPGGAVLVYRKTHLHMHKPGSPINEPDFLLPGNELRPFNTRLGCLGVMICNDGVYLETARTLVLQGADVILWPTRSGTYLASTDMPRWRAFDNSVAVVQVEGGQAGPHMQLQTWSMAVEAEGTVLVSQKGSDAPFRVSIDVAAGRRLCASADGGAFAKIVPRRPDLYGPICAGRPGNPQA